MPRKSTATHIGTSGWNYKHWKGRFYPEDLAQSRWLEFYSERLHTVEINNSFYRLPTRESFQKWHDAVPESFVFSVKASRFITHMKKLKDPKEHVEQFLGQIEPLGDKLGPILFQLPPRFAFNEERLHEFLRVLSKDFRYVFEFRDHSWLNDCAYELLAKHDACCCLYDFDGFESPAHPTTDFMYIRLHGPTGKYTGCYDSDYLTRLTHRITGWQKDGMKTWCYFDNDEKAYAAFNACDLQERRS